MLSNANNPHACPTDMIFKGFNFEFGFVTGRGSEDEWVLLMAYRRCIAKCSFAKSRTAFQPNNLVARTNAKGVVPMHKDVQHLQGFMKTGCNHWRPAVYG